MANYSGRTADTMMSAANNAEPFHTFPESRFEILEKVIPPLAVIGLIGFGVWHFLNEPRLKEAMPSSSICGWIIVIFVMYVLPSALFIASFVAIGDDDNGFLAIILFAIGVEAAVNLILLFRTYRHRLFPRLGRRTLFISMSVVIGSAVFTDQYNHIDYYGPVCVTNMGIQFYRPEQEVDSNHPSYYYYYRLYQTLEWGSVWGCPSPDSDQWCNVAEALYPEECTRRIDCQGQPQGTGECATLVQQKEAETYLMECFLQKVHEDGLSFNDFISKNFTRDVAPWKESPQPHTVTRAISCSACTAQTSAPPKKMEREASLEWLAAGLLVLVGCGLLLLGVTTGQEQQANPSSRFFQRVTAQEVSHDLELFSNYDKNSNSIPIAQAVPIT